MDQSRSKYVEGLRSLADFLAEHPDVPTPNDCLGVVTDKAGAVAWARAYPKVEKDWLSNYLILRGMEFGGLHVEVYTERQAVCRRIVKGTRQVPERIVPAHEEDIVEWECDEPLLAAR